MVYRSWDISQAIWLLWFSFLSANQSQCGFYHRLVVRMKLTNRCKEAGPVSGTQQVLNKCYFSLLLTEISTTLIVLAATATVVFTILFSLPSFLVKITLEESRVPKNHRTLNAYIMPSSKWFLSLFQWLKAGLRSYSGKKSLRKGSLAKSLSIK